MDPEDPNTVGYRYDGTPFPLPGIDSINMWDYLTGAASESPRTEIPLVSGTRGALIVGDYKIVRGSQVRR